MTGQQRFDEIVGRYKLAYKGCNGKEPHKIWYENGYVHLYGRTFINLSKFRISKLEKMTEALEGRLNGTN